MQTLHMSSTSIVTHKVLTLKFPVRRFSIFALRFLMRFNLISLFYIKKETSNKLNFIVTNMGVINRKFRPSWSRNLSYRFTKSSLVLLKKHTGLTLFLFATPWGLKTLAEVQLGPQGGVLLGYF